MGDLRIELQAPVPCLKLRGLLFNSIQNFKNGNFDQSYS